MRRFQAQHAHKRYLPKQSRWKLFCSWWKKRKRNRDNVYIVPEDIKSYKHNPFKKPEKKPRNISLNIKIIIFVLILITWGFLLFYLPFFQIKKININGLQNIKLNEILAYINDNLLYKSGTITIIPKNNYFLVDENTIKKEIIKNFPIKEIEITKTFPNKLSINITEKVTSIIYDNESQYYLMDNNGSLIKFLSDTQSDEFSVITLSTSTTSTVDGQAVTTTIHIPQYKKIEKDFGTYPIVYDKRKKEIRLKDNNLIPLKYIDNIVLFNEEFEKWGKGDIKYYILENIGSGVKAVTTNIWDVYIDPAKDISNQLNNLKVIIKDNKVQQYIDLRFEDRVFWK